MGNADSSHSTTKKTSNGDFRSHNDQPQSSLMIQSSISGDSTGFGTFGSGIGAVKRPLPYRRYYPMSQQKNDDFFRSCPVLETNSPLRKRLRVGEDSFSLPAALCEPDPRTLSGANLLPSLGDSFTSEMQAKVVTFDEQNRQQQTQRDQRPQSCCDFLETEEQFVTCRNELDFSSKPITSAVISKGLKAKFKSFSAWLLHEPPGQVGIFKIHLKFG